MSPAAPVPYVLFPGTAREALERYRAVFGGELGLHTYAEFGRLDGPPEAIAHGVLIGPVRLYGSDAGADDDALTTTGIFLALLGTADPDTLRRWFDVLTTGGRVIDPLQRRVWGAWDGRVRDAYGLTWLVGWEEPDQAA